MAYGKFPGTNKNFFPGLRIACSNRYAAASAQNRFNELFTATNIQNWFTLNQDGVTPNGLYPLITLRHSWREWYTPSGGNTRPAVP